MGFTLNGAISPAGSRKHMRFKVVIQNLPLTLFIKAVPLIEAKNARLQGVMPDDFVIASIIQSNDFSQKDSGTSPNTALITLRFLSRGNFKGRSRDSNRRFVL